MAGGGRQTPLKVLAMQLQNIWRILEAKSRTTTGKTQEVDNVMWVRRVGVCMDVSLSYLNQMRSPQFKSNALPLRSPLCSYNLNQMYRTGEKYSFQTLLPNYPSVLFCYYYVLLRFLIHICSTFLEFHLKNPYSWFANLYRRKPWVRRIYSI